MSVVHDTFSSVQLFSILRIFKMAEVNRFWLKNLKSRGTRLRTVGSKSQWTWKGCIFQQVFREYCLAYREGEKGTRCLQIPHMLFLTKILLDCLLSHRFNAALECMVGLCGMCKKFPEMFWRVGCEVLRHLPGSHVHTKKFINSMFTMCSLFKEELLLDYSMYLTKHSLDITEAHALLTGKIDQSPFATNPLFRGYLGLFEFLLWKKNKLQLEKRSVETQAFCDWSGFVEQSHDVMFKEQMDFHGKKALSFFHGLVENIGVWDIFIARQIELMKFYNRADDARKVLERYKEKNAENPNAHRCLYHFLKTEKASNEELFNVLEGLLAVDPTSELSKEYARLTDEMSKTGNSCKLLNTLQALFNKLDYASCRENFEAWETFATVLWQSVAVHGRNIIKELWAEREDWWPQYHFRPDQVPSKSCVTEEKWKLISHKAEVARCLLGLSNQFTMAVRKQDSRLSGDKSSSGVMLNVSLVPLEPLEARQLRSPKKGEIVPMRSEFSSPVKRKKVEWQNPSMSSHSPSKRKK